MAKTHATKSKTITTAFFIGTAFLLLNTMAMSAEEIANPFANLSPRLIGPAAPSGRISDFSVNPKHTNIMYVATASGGVWKTSNKGTTWDPIFDNAGSYATGDVELDPTNPHVIWVGTGENNSQRSVANGNGVYKSIDGGKTWTNMGLKDSGHISQIWINPSDGDHVRVSSQGPLWNKGGDRGLFETQNGGKTWSLILEIGPHTGVYEFAIDPKNPDRIVASTYQRRRHVWTLINGGPGSGIHRSEDGGKTWSKITSGLPKTEMGRIGLAQAPSTPDTLYTIVEANDADKGIYVSHNFGVTWQKQSSHMTTSPQYYNELVVDPKDPKVLYSLDTLSKISKDGGKTWQDLSIKARHVDDHALWIDPDNTEHLIIGGDGGVYESWDRGQIWSHANNLPITQFYRITPDNAEPFYNVCGGTQDNNSLCAPSRTTNIHGITNSDWKIILGGDGYKAVSDPYDPNIVYTQYQYGGLARYDRRTQERVYITPMPASGENDYKWNWNTPILISPHKHTRLYYAAEKLFVSDDRGDNWRVISPDLTRGIDRNKLKVMDRVWSVDAIAKNDSTSRYGSVIGLSESQLKEGLIYVGTDDGLIQISEDSGATWRKIERFKGVPDMSLIEDVIASVHDENIAYAVVDNHKRGDFKPYILKTTDKGKRWKLLKTDLPVRGTVHTIAEDHIDPDLLFAGTEYGLFFSQNGGENWHQIKGGFPTISVRDIEIQRRENDLVIATFGRGIYIVDDYSPLRSKVSTVTTAGATLFPVKDAWQYIVGDLWGQRPKGMLGAQFFQTPNPDFGAVFSYYIKDTYITAKKARLKSEATIQKDGEDTPYPDYDTLRAENTEEAPSVQMIVHDNTGAVVRKLKGKTSKGFHRTSWDLRFDAPDRVDLNPRPLLPWEGEPIGPQVLPGTYSVQLAVRQNGVLSNIGDPQSFTVKALDSSPEITKNRPTLLAFQQKTSELYRAIEAAGVGINDMAKRLKYLKEASLRTAGSSENLEQQLRSVETSLTDIRTALYGDRTVRSINEPTPMSINGRVGQIMFGHWGSQSDVTGLHKQAYEIAAHEFAETLAKLKQTAVALDSVEASLEAAGAPATPGRLPLWQPE